MPKPTQDKHKCELIEKLLKNRISARELAELCPLVNEEDLAYILQCIYDLNEKSILEIAALTGLMKLFDDGKNQRRNARFQRQVKKWDKTGKNKTVVLVEGDSWFNYPIILTDVIDSLSMDDTLAVYSIAKGGDWLLNMLTGRKYVEELSVLYPDFFLISGGGNDIVGSSRLAAIVDPNANDEFEQNQWAKNLRLKAKTQHYDFDQVKFEAGIKHLSKDFFALLMFFHLQYYFLINGILHGGKPGGISKFKGITILTQGYDYPIPSLDKGFGPDISKWYIPFIRLFLGHGSWLKIPLLTRGITDAKTQENILYAMIFLFNEMMIGIGHCFNSSAEKRVLHIDSRDSVGRHGWTDELHAQPKHFLNTGRAFSYCIHDKGHLKTTYDAVYVVSKIP